MARALGATPVAARAATSRCRWRGRRSRSGVALALLETLNDIGASEYLGVQTLTLSIFTTWLNRGSLPGAAQIACLMLLIVAGADRARTLRPAAARRFTGSTRSRARRRDRADRPGAMARAWRRASLPVVLGFLLPRGLSRRTR